jgi:TolB-like protein/DNA-binding winged helix-turn-helix (wHTH) protein
MIYRFGDCAVDTQLYSVQRGGQSLRLRPKVFRMCLYLLEHRDRVVSREELCAQLWPGRSVRPVTLQGVIRSVRQALGDSGRAQGIIRTRYREGYRFVAAVEEDPANGAGGPAAVSSALRVPPEASDLRQTNVDIPSVALTQESEAMSAREGLGDAGRGIPRQNGYGADRRAGIDRGERQLARQRAARAWLMIGVGLAVVMVALVLLGRWGLWRGISEHTAMALDKSRIAVLPFIDLSAEANQAHLADGMTQELITQLAQIHGLTVIARASIMKYKGTLKDVATIGHELRVGTILEGSVRTVDNQMRINAQLIDVNSQGHLWSHEYDRALTGVFGIQSDIATHVAQQLKVQLLAVEKPWADLPAQAQHVPF